MEEKKKKIAKQIAEETVEREKNQSEFMINQIMGSISLDLEGEENIIAKVRIGSDVYDIWKPDKEGTYTMINTTTHKKDSTLHLSKEDVIKEVLKAFFSGSEYKKIAKKLSAD